MGAAQKTGPLVVAGLVQACIVGTACVVACVLPDIDHIPIYLWFFGIIDLNPAWTGRHMHVWFLGLFGAICCGFLASLVGLSVASWFVKDKA